MPEMDPLGFMGREFVGFVAGCPMKVVDEALVENAHPDHQAVGVAIKRCGSLLADVLPEQVPSAVAGYERLGESTRGNLLRYEVCGDLPFVPEISDQLLAPLGRLGMDVFPALLLNANPRPAWGRELPSPSHTMIGDAISANPATREFLSALERDSLMDTLAPAGSTGFLTFPSGFGSSIGIELLPHSLIGTAAARLRLLGDEFTLSGLITELADLLADFRRIAEGNPIKLPVVTAFRGVQLQPGTSFELPWGRLRPLDEGTSKGVGHIFSAQSSLFVTLIEGIASVGDASGAKPPMVPQKRIRAFETELDTRLRKTSLALLLAEENEPIAAAPVQTTAITPLFGTGWGLHGSTPEPIAALPGILMPDRSTALNRAAALVQSHYAPSLAIPTRRLISARTTRHDVEDGLVDAVVALESLFAGSDAGELTFRIAASIAWLVGESTEERLALHREVGGLYRLRSKILHRGQAGENVADARDRTVELATKAIRALLSDHPDLVGDENRGKTLIMRGESRE
jgi:hypothetical protein